MSRSKEGYQNNENLNNTQQSNEPTADRTYLDERLGAKGQTDYTGGRESYREFPRRSTSAKRNAERSSEQGQVQEPTRYGRRGGLDYENRGSARYRGREASQYGTGDVSPRDLPGRSGSYDRSRYGTGRSEHEGRYDRHSYDDLRSGRADHEDFGRTSGRYRPNERDYERGSSSFASERSSYGDPYNREAQSDRYDYARHDYGSSSRFRENERRDEDYDTRSEWRGRGRERNYLRCSDIMTKDVTSCSPLTSVREVADKMDDENVGVIPVIDNGRLIGIVTDRDIVCRVLANGRDTRTTPVSEAMSEEIVTCLPDDSIHEAIRKMGEHQIRRVAVCDMNGRLRGIISLADIALEAEQDRELAQAVERISQPTPNRSRKV